MFIIKNISHTVIQALQRQRTLSVLFPELSQIPRTVPDTYCSLINTCQMLSKWKPVLSSSYITKIYFYTCVNDTLYPGENLIMVNL